jgi:DNA modification methylase
MQERVKAGARPPRIRTGDVWRLGSHRLVCGDATLSTAASIALGDDPARLMVTDPPYGVGYDPTWRIRLVERSGRRKTVRACGAVTNDDRADWRRAWQLFSGDVAYVWHSGRNATLVADSLRAADFVIRAQIIWDKRRLIISRGHYHWRHEPCWYAVRRGRTAHWVGDRKQVTVWPISHRRSETGHAAQKPIECMLRPILNHSREGDAVYDPFLGSGTTLIAAEMAGRRCHAIEIEPTYVALAIGRWEALTGAKAELVDRLGLRSV